MVEEQSEATLKLKILSAEGIKDIRFLGKMKSFAVAWIDPHLKKSTKTLTTPTTTNPNWNSDLSFPLSLQTLQNPNSCITIQIISPSSPIHRERVIGSTILSLSEVRFEEDLFTLQLWRPSGRAYGLLRVSARTECNLRYVTYSGCVTGIPVDSNSIHLPPLTLDQMNTLESRCIDVVPSAPPMPDESNKLKSFLIGLIGGAIAVATVMVGNTYG